MMLNKQTGLLDAAKLLVSPNYDERPKRDDIDALIIHAISLPPGCFGGEHIEALFTNCLNPDDHPYFAEICTLRVSAHFLIRRDGALVQFVPTHQRAWHAGESIFTGRSAVNDFSIGIELEGCDEEIFEVAQYKALSTLTSILCTAYPSITRERIVGHSDIAPGRKTDPGPYFNWEYYHSLLEETSYKYLENKIGLY